MSFIEGLLHLLSFAGFTKSSTVWQSLADTPFTVASRLRCVVSPQNKIHLQAYLRIKDLQKSILFCECISCIEWYEKLADFA